jgi:hypothetical protein
MAILQQGERWKEKLLLKTEYDALKWREFWFKRAEQNRRVREGLLEAFRTDLLFYVNLCVWQYNPREVGREVGPFITWPFQDRAFPFILKAIDDQVNLVSEKSRDMGLSWMYDVVADWLCLFHRNKKVLMISKSEAAVESESPDSLFWKIDFMHDNLPDWIKGGEIRRRKLFFGYPNGSSITGEASTGRAGVGGRATVILIDEFAQIREDWEVLHRTSDTSYCRLFNSTHMGLDTAFYKLCYDRQSFPESSWRKLVLHWTEHPKKRPGLYRFDEVTNQVEVLDKSYKFGEYPFLRTAAPVGGPFPGIRSPWYDRACADKGSERAVAMDLDINPQGSVSQVFNPLTIARLKAEFANPPYWEGDIEFDLEKKVVTLVRREKGPLKLWCHVRGDRAAPGRYKMGIDLSAGIGATNSCISIIDADLCEKVASYTTAQVTPDRMAPIAVALCLVFQDHYDQGAQMVWECPGPGMLFGETILKLRYHNIYFRTQEERSGPRLISRDKAETPGWFQSNDGKRWLIDRYCSALQSKQYVTREEEELQETLAFRWCNDGRGVEHSGETSGDDPSGARINHGDRVVASALAWMLCGSPAKQAEKEASREVPVNSLAWRRQLMQNREPDEFTEPIPDREYFSVRTP